MGRQTQKWAVRVCGSQNLDEGCNKLGDGVPKPVWEGSEGRGRWGGFTKEGTFESSRRKSRLEAGKGG